MDVYISTSCPKDNKILYDVLDAYEKEGIKLV